jgi:hypothetical protein
MELGLRNSFGPHTGEQSGLLMRIAAPVKRSVVRADDKLTTFIELEAAIRDVWVSDAVASR